MSDLALEAGCLISQSAASASILTCTTQQRLDWLGLLARDYIIDLLVLSVLVTGVGLKAPPMFCIKVFASLGRNVNKYITTTLEIDNTQYILVSSDTSSCNVCQFSALSLLQ